MSKKDFFYCKDVIRFSLKNATKPISTIRLRVNLHGERLTFYLPVEYKIQPRHWDKEMGCAIEDSKRNPDLKGNIRLQLILRNINKEIEKTTNALIKVLEEMKLHEIYPSVDTVRTKLREELNQATKEKRMFADFISFMEYYISLCKDGTILNSKGGRLAAGTIQSYASTLKIVKQYCANRRVKLRLDGVTVNFYNDFVKFMNEASHSRGKYKPNAIGKFVKSIKAMLRYAYENNYTANDDFKRREFKVYKDSFIVSSYTGLRYSDIARLQQKHLDFDNKLLTIVTQKTNTLVVIPMHPKVEAIFRKYGNQPPAVQSNQSTNRVLKKLCRKAGITNFVSVVETSGGIKHEITHEKCDMVTSHTARRSFATNAYRAGIPSLSIMQITGHSTETSFMKYIRISKEENAIALSRHTFFQPNV